MNRTISPPEKIFCTIAAAIVLLWILPVSAAMANDPHPPVYDASPHRESRHLLNYEQDAQDRNLKVLRETYGLDSLLRNTRDDAEAVRNVVHWVHTRWTHDPDNRPSRGDALTILREANEGKRFRCVEYAIVTTACLNAVGYKARTVGLYSRDVESAPVDAGHVGTEVYLNDFHKWAFVDAQWDVLPSLYGFPLNAVELGEAIARREPDLKILSRSGVTRESYTTWIAPYLFYMDVAFDNSHSIEGADFDASGKTRLMLVPLGAKNPVVFQQRFRIDNCIYTNSLSDFYEQPEEVPLGP